MYLQAADRVGTAPTIPSAEASVLLGAGVGDTEHPGLPFHGSS